MKVLHLAAGNRWTGAAAPAFAEVEALREAGVDAHYAYVGGYKLEAKLRGYDFAHPVIAKAQNPVSFWRTVRALGRLNDEHQFDVVHAHLTWDHVLARFAARGRRAIVARTFHSRRTLRRDLFTRGLTSGTGAVFVINDALAGAGLLRGRGAIVTPPPLDRRVFTPGGPNVRAAYGIGDVPVIAMIGKLAEGRGFESGIRTFALLRRTHPTAKLMIIGHGEHGPALESLASSLGIGDAVVWAGYHEDDLAEHYRAADVLLFTAAGSDEGHRAVIEAMGCGVVPAAFRIEGMTTVLGELTDRFSVPSSEPADLAALAGSLLATGRESLQFELNRRTEAFSFERSAHRLIDCYSSALASRAGFSKAPDRGTIM